MLWQVPPEWKGERCYIIGGGPSVAQTDCRDLPGRIIAINEAGLSVRPDADVLFFADWRWYDWNRHRLGAFTGGRIVTTWTGGRRHPVTDERLHVLERFRSNAMPHWPISDDPSKLSGWCGGGQAVNLAYHFGAKQIVLIGFDMHDDGPPNFHDNHNAPPIKDRKKDKFIPSIVSLKPGLDRAHVRVVNCTPGSALTCFPVMSLNEFHALEAAT
jgi:uncharacterized Rossmann fold enzyme